MPEGGSGSDDEYRSVVFDESFVRAARITELSADERLGGHVPRAIRHKFGLGALASLPRQAVTLLLLVVLAFGAAVYFGVTAPQHEAARGGGTQLTAQLTALTAPQAPPAADPNNPFGTLPATAGYADGSAGLGLPVPTTGTTHFSQTQVAAALDTVRRYLEASELTASVLVQGETAQVRQLLAPAEQSQFDAATAAPADDQHHAVTGWMVRFDPMKVALASNTVKVAGSVSFTELDPGTLEITGDHTLVYALRPAGAPGAGPVSLYTVRREVRFDVDHNDVAYAQLRLVDSVEQAGPSPCGAAQAEYLQPQAFGAAGAPAASPGAVNPADHAHPAWQSCAVLASPKG
ncbi:hypothetical protein C7C46_20350 [Streptomyces tateyamensis]|uniref:Uncharacterized protein n=1 Tax=Streptomyces tateyamensis TaxID=565073 RepID=A0A2V4NMG0_9ACTN|nr:hypothetical protein C7C46_20350 [Streptomyces tateyamensis]